MRDRAVIEKALVRKKPMWHVKTSEMDWRGLVRSAVAVELLLDIRDLMERLVKDAEGSR